ncbi:MAG: hypothetical protein A3I66_03765 [Burkholderiales bacterium RIFCSPLOWO2_02_FULL_57_36]|nr:MAG: hypothetical protein A3I66_03765 [Burkholderiales bacterium RIFCSPLOWO2_02_FULL_57_36]
MLLTAKFRPRPTCIYPSAVQPQYFDRFSQPNRGMPDKTQFGAMQKADSGCMKKSRAFFLAAPIFLSASIALAQNTVINAPDGAGATTIYRQIMPDGRIVYSDTITKGVKIDRILSVPHVENRTAAKPAAAERMRGGGNPGGTAGSTDAGR